MNVHFIAIGGSAMHNLAIALHKKGFIITGSDDVFAEPSKSRLNNYSLLPEKSGWDEGKITSDLDAVILGMHAKTDNPELIKAQQKKIRIYSYPEYVYEQSKDKLRIVIGGSHGKTTITSMILHVLKAADKAFDYLVGAQLAGFDTMVKITDAPIIVIEGDEYLASPIDRRPKFHLYKANIGVISGIAWDHINVFPTFADYKKQFEIFIDTIQFEGTLIYCKDDDVLADLVNNHVTSVVKKAYTLPKYQIEDGITTVISDHKNYPLQVFGHHNLLNLEAARRVCNLLNIDNPVFYNAMQSFAGAAKRLEIIASNNSTIVFKDFAHSPSKLIATINAVKHQYPNRQLIACIELHTFSSLNKAFLTQYAGTMHEADKAVVFIDRETYLQKNIEPYPDSLVKDSFKRDDLIFFDQATKLFEYLKGMKYNDTNLLLMSSGTFAHTDLVEFAETIL